MARPAAERQVALLAVAVFVAAGLAWIIFGHTLLHSVVKDPALIARLEIAKGSAFVGLAGVLLYVVIRRTAQLAKTAKTIAAVVESIGDGVLLLGRQRTIAYANPAAIQMLGVANVEALRGMDATEFSRRFHVEYPDGRVVPPNQFVSQRVFDEAGPIRYKAILHPTEDHELVIWCTAAGVRPDIGETAEIVVSVMHDVTVADHLDNLRDDLFAATAHAIKTPVAAIKGASQILSVSEGKDLRRSTVIIERQCARIERLIDNLFALARIRTGTLQLYPTKIELGPIVQDLGREITKISDGRDIRVHVHDRCWVRADQERLEMALRNEIHAAARLSEPRRPVVVDLECHGADIEIAVSYHPDPSSGSTPEERQSVVDLDDMGVGRGVTTIILEAHGGTLTESADGSGATVRMRMPAVQELAA